MDTGLPPVDKNGKMLVLFDTGSAHVMSPKGNIRSSGHIGQKGLESYDYYVMDIGGDNIQDGKIQKRLQKMIDKYVVPSTTEDEETQPNTGSMSKADIEKKKSSTVRSGPSFYDFPDCLKGTEWLKDIKLCKETDSRRASIPKKGGQKAPEKNAEELIASEKEEVGDIAVALTPEDEDKAWESLRQSGFLEHIDENDPKLIAKNTSIAAMNKFKLHPIKQQVWDIRKALDGTRPVTRQEVAFHCDNGDILLIRNRRVINAMNIVINHYKEHQDKILPLIRMKGTDISHWFNPITGEPRTKIDLKTGKKVLHIPNGFYYGLGPIRRQLELRQDEETRTPSIKSSALTDLNEGQPTKVESDLSKDYETFLTDNYTENDVSGFEPPKRHSVFSESGLHEEKDGEDMEMIDEGVEDVETGEESGEDEVDGEEENIGTKKSKKSSSGSDEASNVTTPDTGSSPKAHSKEVKSNPNSSGNASPDPSMLPNPSRLSISREHSISSNPNLSTSRLKKSVGEVMSVMRIKSKTSIAEREGKEEALRKGSTKTEHKDKPHSNETDEQKTSAEDKSGETDSNYSSPQSMSPKGSGINDNQKKSIQPSISSEGEGEYLPSEDESDDEALEDVLSRMSINPSIQSIYAAEGSQFDVAMSTVPLMGSEHSLLSEVPSVYSKTTVDTTAIASTVYGVQTDVFPGVSWTVHDPNYEEKWWLDPKYLCGYIPKSTLNIRIINSLSYDERILVISKEYTINDIMRYYLPYNHNAMGYSWEDMFGNILHPDRTVIENGLIDMALADDNGFNAYPVIILVFIDGFEDEPVISLNPKHLTKQIIPICRNY